MKDRTKSEAEALFHNRQKHILDEIRKHGSDPIGETTARKSAEAEELGFNKEIKRYKKNSRRSLTG